MGNRFSQKKKRNILRQCLTLLFFMCIFKTAAHAATAKIEVVAVGGANVKMAATIEASDTAYPMPEPSKLLIEEGETGYFSVSSNEPGVFHYKIRLDEEKYKNILEYDRSVYIADVYFIIADDTGALRSYVVLYKEGSEEKALFASFDNSKTHQHGTKREDQSETETEKPNDPNDPKGSKKKNPGVKKKAPPMPPDTSQTDITASGDPTGKSSTDNIKTGDDTPILLWAAILGIAFAGMFACFLILRNRRTPKR